jgi:acetyl-CoA synthetase (ADP-forming)
LIMETGMEWIVSAVSRGARSLSEYEAKRFLSGYGIPTTAEKTVRTLNDALAAADSLGFPVALKGSGEDLPHKTELGLVRLGLKNEAELQEAYRQMTSGEKTAPEEFLVQQMVTGDRELLAGLVRDPQFGPAVMLGLGGIYTEVLRDAVFRVAPLSRWDASHMMDELRGRAILDAFRGMPPVDRGILADILIALGAIGLEHSPVREIDINPLKIQTDGRPIAVDALVVLG